MEGRPLSPAGRPAVFFDRDGIVNLPPGPGRYVERPRDFRLAPGFPAVLRLVARRGYPAIVVTNQRGVALGRMTAGALSAIHRKMARELAREGLGFLDILSCTAGEDSDPRRKPNPGMLLEAAARHGLDLGRSWMIGDSERDIEAGARAGCRTVRVGTDSGPTKADWRAATLEELAERLEAGLPRVSREASRA